MIYKLIISLSVCLSFSCTQSKNRSAIEIIKFDPHIVDSLKQASDTVFRKFIGRKDFYYSDNYANRKDNSSAKILLDSIGNVVGFNKGKDGRVYFAAEYFPNGQIMGKLPENRNGAIEGPVKYYYEDGRVRIEGQFKNGRRFGQWNNYDKDGYLTSFDEYNGEGQKIRSTKVNK